MQNFTSGSTSNITTVIQDIPGLSEKVRRIGIKYNIKITFETPNALRSLLTHTKPDKITQKTNILDVLRST